MGNIFTENSCILQRFIFANVYAKLYAYGFSIKSLEFINSRKKRKETKSQKKFSFSEWCYVTCGVPQRSNSEPFLFKVYICDLFLSEIDIDFANKADGSTPNACDSKID